MSWNDFIKSLKESRLEKGLTQKDLADKLNVTPQFICMIESGKKKLSADKLMSLAKILNLEIS